MVNVEERHNEERGVFPNLSGEGGRLKRVCLARWEDSRGCVGRFFFFFPIVVSCAISANASQENPKSPSPSRPYIEQPFVVTQLPVGTSAEQRGVTAGGMLRANFGDGTRLVMVYSDRSVKVLTDGFHSACDPEVSFDASHILFAGKRSPSDRWNIFEMASDGSNIRQVTDCPSDCRSPAYQATLYTLDSPKPWYQLTFVGSQDGILNECGVGPATSLYSCKLDGSAVRRLTFNLSIDMDPFIMYDGRVLYASWQRSTLTRGVLGRIALFGINIDGTDCALFSVEGGKRVKHIPCTTTKGLAVFVEADSVPWDGAGTLACVRLQRPLHSYRQITKESDGLFHSPYPLPDGRILVSRRPADGSGTHGVYRLDPSTGQFELIFDSPDYHDIQARAIYRRAEPDGRSTVVAEEDPNGKLYCLNVYISDLEQPQWLPHGTVKRLRVLEGIPVTSDVIDASRQAAVGGSVQRRSGIPPLAQRRILGEIPVEEDGSFNIEIPANIPVELQTLDSDGMALQTCSWIWVKNHEPRGCIGCHEDGELTPENVLAKALTRPSIKLTLPAERRRTVDFRRNVMPIIAKKCVRCHADTGSVLRLTSDAAGNTYFNQSYENLLAPGKEPDTGKYVHPGRARTSPLTWRIFGRNTSRPWDRTYSRESIQQMPPPEAEALTEDEKRTFVEWIDAGALWDGVPGPDALPGSKNSIGDQKR